jgi:hypothetical protein
VANWKPKTAEDRLLKSYWKNAGGVIYTQVPVGGCRGRMPRRPRMIDGVRLHSPTAQIKKFKGNRAEFSKLIDELNKAEVIEAKVGLNRGVIGQALVGEHLLETKYPESKADPIVVCKRRNRVLQDVCKELKIKVWTPRRKFVVQ